VVTPKRSKLAAWVRFVWLSLFGACCVAISLAFPLSLLARQVALVKLVKEGAATLRRRE
jgi:hypothetical protein